MSDGGVCGKIHYMRCTRLIRVPNDMSSALYNSLLTINLPCCY